VTITESVRLREIKKRLAKNHATRADIEQAREILSDDESALAKFNDMVARQLTSKSTSDTTAADRKRRQRERDNAFTVESKPGDPGLRESCRFDLMKFGVTYCPNLLNHSPSDLMVRSLILPLQNAILYGGQSVVQFPRGVGKTSWMKIAMVWSVVYGHKRFIMTVAATRDYAKAINEQILLTFEESEPIRRDFPALASPIVALAGNWRKASTQKFEGRPTRMVNSDGYIVLPTIYKTGTDEPVEVAAGSVFYTAGIHGAIRGISRGKQRPDMIFFDDPQTREEAESTAASDKLERLIEGDALGNFGQTDVRSCIMAVTPIRQGDIATRFSDRRLHAAWGSSKQPAIVRKSDLFDELFPAYREAYADDVAAQKQANLAGCPLTGKQVWANSTQFYLDHRDDFAGTEVIDSKNFNKFEIDAIHHILNVKASYRDQSLFDAEMQMDVSPESEGSALDPDEVASRVNGFPRNVLPPGTFDAVAFIDVNTQKGAGLRWGVTAFGPGRVAAVVNYGQYPADGSALVPKGASPAARRSLVRQAVTEVLKTIVRLPLRHPNGTRVFPIACGVDAGYASDAVHEAVATVAATVNLHGMDLFATLGRAWSQYKVFKKSEEREVVSKDHVYSGVTVKRVNGKVYARKYLGMHADYWREVAQKSFLAEPLTEGSVSIFGDSPSEHRDFANEITYEKLVRTYREDKRPFRQAWEWVNENPGHNHSMDLLYGCFAIACWKDIYRAQMAGNLVNPKFIKPSGKADWLTPGDAEAVAAIKKPRSVVRRTSKRFHSRFVKR